MPRAIAFGFYGRWQRVSWLRRPDLLKANTLLHVNPELDTAQLASQYRAHGRVRINRILADGASYLLGAFEQSENWVQLINHREGVHEIPYRQWTKPNFPGRKTITNDMFENACDGFQYNYAALRLPNTDENHPDTTLADIAGLMESQPMLKLLEAVTGVTSPYFTDGQATAYGCGDFLTGHDDDLVGARRRTAFVLGLTPQWRTEWGGLLLFHDHGHPELQGLLPQFNTLDLFAVPKYHSVSLVSKAAPRRRFAITGWLSAP